ncbi:MAG: hypothetical protein GDA51_10940 [Ekhidna sp.]|nr:hypothetical protein [Ekhidna sp.]MBC6426956.1 hypothetical protein [Ekhidna sp.]
MSDQKTLDLFKKILNSRILSRSQLAKEQTDQSDIENSLQALKSLGLINEKKSAFHDFDKYYPTKEGLEVEKIIK